MNSQDSDDLKKWWAPIWSGLVIDPKHQARMGSAVWVYLYLQSYADRDTGRLFRNCETIADEMGRSVKTIRRQIEKLEKLEYIVLTRKQYGFWIQITKWKPIKKIKGLAVVPDPNEGEIPPPRLDTSVQSERPKGVQFIRWVPSQSGHCCPSEWTLLSLRVDTSVQSLYRKYKESNKKRINKVVVEKPVNFEKEMDWFFKFAAWTHSKNRHCNFYFDPSDRGKVGGLLEKHPLKTLCAAWWLLCRSDEPYIRNRYPDALNISIFAGQLRNFTGPAEKFLTASRVRRGAAGQSRDIAPPVDPAEAGKWARCLREIQGRILPENYSTVIEPLVFGGVEQGKGVILCPSKFYLDCVVENYFDLIQGTMTQVFGVPMAPELLLFEDTG